MTPSKHSVNAPCGRLASVLSVAVSAGCLFTAPRSWAAASAEGIQAQVRIKTARVTGNHEATKVFETAVTQKQPALLRCYRGHLTKQPGAVGLLGLSVRIEPTGKVTEVTAQPTRVPQPLVDCTRKAIGAWQVAGWKTPQRAYADFELVFQLSAPLPSGATAKGGIEAELVAGTIEARLPALREECWTTKQPARSPTIRLVTEFDGTIQTADLSGRIPNRTIHRCLVARLKTWDFPPPDNGHRTWIFYPLFSGQRPPTKSPPPRGGQERR